jgi:hypothetical protein
MNSGLSRTRNVQVREPVNPVYAALCLIQLRGPQIEKPRQLHPPSISSNELAFLEDAASGSGRTGSSYVYDFDKREYVLPGSGVDREIRFADDNYGKRDATARIGKLAEEGTDCSTLLPSLLRTLDKQGVSWFVRLHIMRAVEKIALSGTDCTKAKAPLQKAKKAYESEDPEYLLHSMSTSSTVTDCINAANSALAAIELVENNRATRSNPEFMKRLLSEAFDEARADGTRIRLPLVVVDSLTGMAFVRTRKTDGFVELSKFPLLDLAVDRRPPTWRRSADAFIENKSTISLWAPTYQADGEAFKQIVVDAMRDSRISISP